MLGHRLLIDLERCAEVWATFHGRVNPYLSGYADRAIESLNVTDFEKVVKIIGAIKPDVIINAVGIIKQREEIKDAAMTIQVNSVFPNQIAELCSFYKIRLIHLSTDCVFSGNRGNYTEYSTPDPVDFYGETKLLGEPFRDDFKQGILTLRTSIVGWEIQGYHSLLSWFASQSVVLGYSGAIYTGLSTGELTDIIIQLINRQEYGMFNVSSDPISKHDLLCGLRDALKWDMVINKYDGFQCDRSLNSKPFRRALNWTPMSWDERIMRLANEYETYKSILK